MSKIIPDREFFLEDEDDDEEDIPKLAKLEDKAPVLSPTTINGTDQKSQNI